MTHAVKNRLLRPSDDIGKSEFLRIIPCKEFPSAFEEISGGISWLVWITLGKGFHKTADYLNIDFFNVIGIALTIVGFAIAIYQIAELRDEQQIRNDTIDEFKIRYFKNDALYNLGSVKPIMQALQRDINFQFNFSETIVAVHIGTLNSVNHVLGGIQSQQQNMPDKNRQR